MRAPMSHDVIRVVETFYDMGLNWSALTAELCRTVSGLIPAEKGTAVYTVRKTDDGVRMGHLSTNDPKIVEAYRTAFSQRTLPDGDLLVQALAAQKVFEHGAFNDRGLLASDNYRRLMLKLVTLEFEDTRDVFLMASGSTLTEKPTVILAGGRREVRPLVPSENGRWLRIRAHLEAAVRLRNAFDSVEQSSWVEDADAVIEPSGKVAHAAGDARDSSAREALQSAAVSIDRARLLRNGRGDEALALWKGMIRGEWSLVERFETDGRRYYVAHRNAQNIDDPRGLSHQEARAAAFAARGFSSKLIAYYMGLSEPTVATHLKNATRKLGCDSRAELMRQLGASYPPTCRRNLLEFLAFKPLGPVD